MVKPELIRHGLAAVARVLVFWGVTLAVIAAAPVIALAGEPLRRYYLRRLTRPALIALTAPERWVIDQVASLRSRGFGGRGFGRSGRRGGNWPPAGVREPRRPKPSAPAGAIALAEPRQQPRVIPILKAFPPALSEPVRRVGSFLGQMTGVLRWQVIRRQLGR